MSTYAFPISKAFSIFPFLAILITLPYIFSQYHKYGSVNFIRTIIVYSFILYLTNIYFLVILPLPKMSEVANLTTPYAQLIPLNFISDIIKNVEFDGYKTIINILKSKDLLVTLFNILMTIPFGMYLRYYFKCSLKKTILYSFLLSLFFELTQLSGLYFIYPRPYRLFDVDDLIFNTLGGTIGYFIMGVIKGILPSRDKIDDTSYKHGLNVSFGRRMMAFCINWFILILIIIISSFMMWMIDFKDKIIILLPLIYFIIYTYLANGENIGYKFMNLKIVNNNGKNIKFYQILMRYIILYGVLIPTPLILVLSLSYIGNMSYTSIILTIAFDFILFIFYARFILELLRSIFVKNYIYQFEKISHTKVISTINYKDESE